jgi:hypothetical protein
VSQFLCLFRDVCQCLNSDAGFLTCAARRAVCGFFYDACNLNRTITCGSPCSPPVVASINVSHSFAIRPFSFGVQVVFKVPVNFTSDEVATISSQTGLPIISFRMTAGSVNATFSKLQCVPVNILSVVSSAGAPLNVSPLDPIVYSCATVPAVLTTPLRSPDGAVWSFGVPLPLLQCNVVYVFRLNWNRVCSADSLATTAVCGNNTVLIFNATSPSGMHRVKSCLFIFLVIYIHVARVIYLCFLQHRRYRLRCQCRSLRPECPTRLRPFLHSHQLL